MESTVRRTASYPLLGLILSVCTPSFCLAWDCLGHRTVAEIATRYLSETPRPVQALLGGGPIATAMGDVAIWADDNETPETGPWHMVEIPPDGIRYDRARDCKNDDCVVEKIKQFAEILGDQRLTSP